MLALEMVLAGLWKRRDMEGSDPHVAGLKSLGLRTSRAVWTFGEETSWIDGFIRGLTVTAQ